MSELNFIMTKITKVLDAKAKGNPSKKIAYYRALDAYMLNRYNNSPSIKDKRILAYLHTRLGVVSKGFLAQQTPETITYSDTSVSHATSMQSIHAQETMNPDTPTSPAYVKNFSDLGIDFTNSVFDAYEFNQNKRFPRTITRVLDMFVQNIVIKMDEKKLSFENQAVLYEQILSILDEKLKSNIEIKERKIIQYIRNHIYIKQQEERIGL